MVKIGNTKNTSITAQRHVSLTPLPQTNTGTDTWDQPLLKYKLNLYTRVMAHLSPTHAWRTKQQRSANAFKTWEDFLEPLVPVLDGIKTLPGAEITHPSSDLAKVRAEQSAVNLRQLDKAVRFCEKNLLEYDSLKLFESLDRDGDLGSESAYFVQQWGKALSLSSGASARSILSALARVAREPLQAEKYELLTEGFIFFCHVATCLTNWVAQERGLSKAVRLRREKFIDASLRTGRIPYRLG